MEWDVFISHASEDHETVARPLAERLRAAGLRVWIDEQVLVLGDSLRRHIDKGLASSEWGVVIVSPHFLDKEWPQAELDALISRELSGQRTLLPVWHDISADEIARRAPLLAARLGVDTARGLDTVSAEIVRAMGRGPLNVSQPEQGFLSTWCNLPSPETERTKTLHQLLESRAWAGEAVGDYVLREFRGSGGTGAVFRASHISLGTTAAVKLFYPLHGEAAQLIGATERAVRGLAALRHPNIATLLDFGFVQGGTGSCAYLAHEYIAGVSLSDWCKRGEPTHGERLRVAMRIADGLNAAHNCRFIGEYGVGLLGIVHGDVKPDNILVHGGEHSPVLVDFMLPDIQRLVAMPPRKDDEYGWRKSGNRYRFAVPLTGMFGTPGFMPPEQEVDGIVTPVSDVYALGRTFERLFWGEPVEIVVQRSRPSAPLVQQVQRMVEPEPSDRPQSMAEVLEALRSIQGG
jgi:hypothetical protein